MLPSTVQIDLYTEAFSLSTEIPLAPVEKWWNGLRRRNDRSRARDEFFSPAVVPDLCGTCGADPVHFTIVDDGYIWRTCRKCRSRIGTL